ncbi:leucine-rich_repeat domain-containing protein [Hexamita inflata]|uniref:Partial n=1 Tax=Hexamita inflata TaxID=28002 RepID=A0AA86QVP5_9EUKA|nr:leucine-rich repeat domain-containing protein [Hexamita inflata]
MQPNNQAIRNKKDLLNHFGSSQKLQIRNLQQIERFLKMNVLLEVWEDALNRNLLSFNQEIVKQTQELTFDNRKIECIHLVSFLINLTVLNLNYNQISDISSISKLKNLKKLYLGRNKIGDISALQYLPYLTSLELSQQQRAGSSF